MSEIQRRSFKFISNKGGAVEYEASFWDGPSMPGEDGRYVRRRVKDQIINGRLLNTSPSVSYYHALSKACRLRLADV
jgi:hypothetical protein